MISMIQLTQVSTILPRWKETRFSSQVTYCSREQIAISVRPDTVARWIAHKNYVDFRAAKQRSEALNHLKKGAPLPLGLHDVFLPIHLVEGAEQERPCYGYCNVANQTIDVLAVPNEKNQSLLRLSNGMELLVESGPAKMSAYLSMAIATHRRFAQEILSPSTPPSPGWSTFLLPRCL